MIAVPQAAVDLAKRFEGFQRVAKSDPDRAQPYICPAGFWTIGYGHLCEPTHPPISEAEGEAYLAHDLQTALVATLRYCPTLATEPEGRLAAIVDFTFNLGAGRLQTSTLRRRLNQRDWSGAAIDGPAEQALRQSEWFQHFQVLSTEACFNDWVRNGNPPAYTYAV